MVTEHHQTPLAAPDRLNRTFTATAPDRVWVGDMTFVRTREGWLNLAVLVDLFSRKVVGWAMGPQPNQALALACARHGARPPPAPSRDSCTTPIAAPPTAPPPTASGCSRPGFCQHERAQERLRQRRGGELLLEPQERARAPLRLPTRDQARAAIFDYIELFYNRKRLHQSLGYRTPEEVEREWRGV